jgi:hypothetical protein
MSSTVVTPDHVDHAQAIVAQSRNVAASPWLNPQLWMAAITFAVAFLHASGHFPGLTTLSVQQHLATGAFLIAGPLAAMLTLAHVSASDRQMAGAILSAAENINNASSASGAPSEPTPAPAGSLPLPTP